MSIKQNSLRHILEGEQMRQQLSMALPKHLTAERFIRVAITALTRTPKLAECEPSSFFKCLLDLSSLGIEPDGRRAHLIPRNNRRRGVVECTLIVDWKGLVELAKRSGDVSVWRAELLCANDEFDWVNGEATHRIDWRRPRGDVQAVYSFVKQSNGDVDIEVLTLADIDAARRRGGSADDGPWVTDWAEMAKKTAIRRHSKRLTLSPEIHDLLEAEVEKEATGRVIPKAVVPTGFLPSLPAAAPAAALQEPSEPAPSTADVDDQIPFDEPPAASQAPAPEPEPAPRTRRTRATAPANEAPPLTLSADGPTKREIISKAIADAGYDWERFENMLLENAIIEGPSTLAGLDDATVERIYTNLEKAISLVK